MRSDLFELIEDINDVIDSCIDLCAQVLFRIIELIANVISYIVGIIFKCFLFIVDRSRVHHADEVDKQESITKELEVLNKATEIKNDALRSNWTDKHTESINELSSILFNECGWDETSVHGYMRELVESVPGLQYGTESSD